MTFVLLLWLFTLDLVVFIYDTFVICNEYGCGGAVLLTRCECFFLVTD